MSVKSASMESFDKALMGAYNGTSFRAETLRGESLPETAWKYLDERVIKVFKEELVGIADLNRFSDTSMMFDGMSASVYTRERMSEMGEANIAMTPDTRGESGTLDFDSAGVPLFVAFKNFLVNTKQVSMAASVGLPLQTYLAEEASRSVARALETFLFNGTYKASGATAYGYTTYPDRQTATITDWSGEDPDVIVTQVLGMIDKLLKVGLRGPFVLYVPWEFQIALNKDYQVGTTGYLSGVTTQQRILQIPGVDSVKIAPYLADDNVVLVNMQSNTVQLINALPISVVDWEPAGSPSWMHTFKVLTSAVPFIVSDYDGQCGVVHGSV